MTANCKDSRRYRLPRDLIFRACCDAMQPCGFTVTESDPESGVIRAISTEGIYAETENSTFLGLVLKGTLSRFREHVTIAVDDSGQVVVHSVSSPKTRDSSKSA